MPFFPGRADETAPLISTPFGMPSINFPMLPFMARPREQPRPAARRPAADTPTPPAPNPPAAAPAAIAAAADAPTPWSGFGGTPASSALNTLVQQSRAATPEAATPIIFNGPNQEQPGGGARPGDSPIREDVVRSVGGQGRNLPSVQQFMGSMPQSMTMQFGSGQGQIGNGLGIGGHLTQGYTPAFQGPEQRSDHTNAAMATYANLVGSMLHGPESPTQALVAQNHALNDTLRTRSEYGPGGLRDREITQRDTAAERDRLRDFERYAAGQRSQGVDWSTINRDVAGLRGVSGVGAARPGAAPAPGGVGPSLIQPPNPADDALEMLFNQSVQRAAPTQVGPPGHAPSLATVGDASVRDRALTDFVNGLGQEHFQTPEAINRLRDFIVQPSRFGLNDFNRWFTARPTARSLVHWWPNEQQTAHGQAIDRLIRARNALDPANPIGGATTIGGIIPLSSSNPIR